MLRTTLTAITAFALAAPVMAQERQTMNMTINVGTKDQNGVCSIYLAGEGQLELELSVRADNGNVNTIVHNIPSDWIDDDGDPAIRLTAANGSTYDSAGGAYRAGFTNRAMSFYDTSAEGLAVLAALKGGQSFRATFDGHDAGQFDIQQTSANITDYAYSWIRDCVEDNGGNANF